MPVPQGLEPPKHPALIVLEVQNGIVDPEYDDAQLAYQAKERGTVAKVNDLAAAFRVAKRPAIFGTIGSPTADWSTLTVNCALAGKLRRDGRLVDGTEHAEIHRDIVRAPSDMVSLRHHGMAPFTGTGLDSTLRRLRIDTVVLCGVSTIVALPGASTEAVAFDYSDVLVEDCTAGGTAEMHHTQITMHLPLVTTITPSESTIAALQKRVAS